MNDPYLCVDMRRRVPKPLGSEISIAADPGTLDTQGSKRSGGKGSLPSAEGKDDQRDDHMNPGASGFGFNRAAPSANRIALGPITDNEIPRQVQVCSGHVRGYTPAAEYVFLSIEKGIIFNRSMHGRRALYGLSHPLEDNSPVRVTRYSMTDGGPTSTDIYRFSYVVGSQKQKIRLAAITSDPNAPKTFEMRPCESSTRSVTGPGHWVVIDQSESQRVLHTTREGIIKLWGNSVGTALAKELETVTSLVSANQQDLRRQLETVPNLPSQPGLEVRRDTDPETVDLLVTAWCAGIWHANQEWSAEDAARLLALNEPIKRKRRPLSDIGKKKKNSRVRFSM